jgi:hypothetical protein
MTDCGIPSAVDKEIIAAKKKPMEAHQFSLPLLAESFVVFY